MHKMHKTLRRLDLVGISVMHKVDIRGRDDRRKSRSDVHAVSGKIS